jgi:ribosome-binding protein aMBF1 (putative translation factor)
MRTEQQTRDFLQLMQRLNSQVGVPTPRDLEEIEHLLELTEDVPLSADELTQMRNKVVEIHSRWDVEVFRREVGRRLADARQGAGFSVHEVANRYRLTPAELQLIEDGTQPLSFLEAAQLADLYDVSLDGLVASLR